MSVGEQAPQEYTVQDFEREIQERFDAYLETPEARSGIEREIDDLCKQHPTAYQQYMSRESRDYQ